MMFPLPLLAWPAHQRTLTILTFHRVLLDSDPLRQGEPHAEVFERQMRFVARHFDVLPLLDAVSRLRQGTLPRRSCCITFDDGYEDNLTVAWPILKQFDLTATVFVASGCLGKRMFNDRLIDAIAGSRAGQLDLRGIDLGQHVLESLADRQAALRVISRQLRYRAPEKREQDLATLVELADCAPLPEGGMLSREQVHQLATHGIEIGAHTVTHPILTSIDDDRARHELVGNKSDLEAMTGRPVRALAYPNGKPGRDYDARHVRMAREAGFEAAVSTVAGAGDANSDPFQLPRCAIWGNTETQWAVQLVKNAWIGRASLGRQGS